MDSLERNRRTLVRLAFVSIVLINYMRWNNLEPDQCDPRLAERLAYVCVYSAVSAYCLELDLHRYWLCKTLPEQETPHSELY